VCYNPEGTKDDTDGGHDLVSILQEVCRLRVQLEHCISSNDRLRRTLHKCSAVTLDDGWVTSGIAGVSATGSVDAAVQTPSDVDRDSRNTAASGMSVVVILLLVI